MKKSYLFLSLLIALSVLSTRSFAQNNLAAGDLAIVSYQSDFDASNPVVGDNDLAEFEDRFSLVITKPGGIAAGTVIFFTTRGWNGPANTWHDEDYPPNTFGLGRRAVVQWTVPAGGIAAGTEVFFINMYHDEVAVGSEYYDWGAYSNYAGTIPLGVMANVTPIVPGPNTTDGMSFTFTGDKLLIYQTGPVAGPNAGPNNSTIRFITALLANSNGTTVAVGTTTYANWDAVPGAMASSESSVPPGLVNGQTCFLMSPSTMPNLSNGTTEPDNGKFSACALSAAGACTALQMSAIIYATNPAGSPTTPNWTYSNAVFPLGTASSFCTYNVLSTNTAGAASSTPTLCINTLLTNITHATTGATGIGAPTGLPAGVTANFAANTITISGTPSASGTFNYTIPLTGGCGSVNATGTIIITPNKTAGAPSSTPILCINTVMTNITHATTGATGIGAPTGLPTGVTANFAANTITISGTPTASGVFNYSIPLTGGCGTVNATGTITVNVNTVTLSSGAGTNNQSVTVSTPITNITYTTTGATGATFSGLPAGVTGNWAANVATISGSPTTTVGSPFNYTVNLTGGCGVITTNGTITVTAAASISASLRDALLVDVNSNTIANPGDQLRYTTTIRNPTATAANGVNTNIEAPVNTTLNPGSTVSSALARDDAFSAFANTLLNTGNVVTNDFGMPSVSVVSFGTTASLGLTTPAGSAGTTNQGGTLTVNANGTFSYMPPPAFSGTDQFRYIATTGVAGLPNNDAIVTITVTPDILFTTTPVNPSCNGGSNGSITFSAVSGGSGPVYTYSITGAGGTFQASVSFTGLAAGTYNPAVKDGAGNIKTAAAINLTNPTLITFTHTDVNNTCAGASAGSITFSASGGTGALTYSITGAAGTYFASPSFTGLAAGTYPLAVKDANNCIVTGSATLTDPPVITFTFTKTDVTCNGAGNGTIVFNTTTGGTGPYTYSITGTGGTFFASNSFTSLIPNAYTLVVKDATGCNSATQSTTVTQPAAIAVSGTVPQLTFNTAMTPVTFTKTGGTGSPANPWSATGLPTNLTLNTATGQLSGTPNVTGSFPVVITYTDASGCTGTLSSNIDVAPNIIAETYTDVGNTQLRGGVTAPATPHVSVSSVASNDQSNTTIAYALVSGPTQGAITFNTNGTFLYTPALNNVTAATFVYSGTSNGVSKNATATINFNGKVWYVQAGGAAGDGRSNTPLNALPSATLGGTGDFIYVDKEISGTTPGSIILQANQQLIGAGAALNVPTVSPILTITGVAANTPMLTNTVRLANSVTVNGIDMSTTTNTAITDAAATVTGVSVTARNVTTTTGTGISVTGAGSGVGITFTSLTTGSAVNAVLVNNSSGSVTIQSGAITNTTGASISVSGGTVAINYDGNITQGNNASMVSVSGGHSVGSISFNAPGVLTATNGNGLQFDNADGSYNFGSTTLNGGDAGVDILNGSTGTFIFGGGTVITNPSGTAFNVNGSNANVTYSGTITDNSGFAVDIDNHDANTITFQAANITSNGTGIRVQNCGGGTINFNNPSISLTTGAGAGVTLSTNSGAAINFAPTGTGLDISTTTGVGFDATGGGTVTVTGTGNTITKSGNGNALNVANTNAGGSGINFASINVTGGTGTAVNISASTGIKSLGDVDVARSGGGTGIFASNAGTLNTTSGSINSGALIAVDIDNTVLGVVLERIDVNGGANGIDLNTTTGSFTVNGTGTTDGTGGTIQNTTGRGASFISATNITLKNMNFTNAGTTDLDATNGGLSTGDNLATNAAIHLVTVTTVTLDNLNITGGAEQGINGNTVSAFTLSNSSILNAGNEPDEDGIHFYNMSGTSAITNTTINCTVAVPNTTGGDDHLNLQTQSGTLNLTISGGSATNANKGSGYLFGIRGTTNATITFNNGTSTGNFSGGIVADAFDNAVMDLNVTNSTSSGNNDQLSVSAGDNSNVDLIATGNTLSSVATGDFVVIGLLGSALDNGYTFDASISGNNITVANGLAADGILVNNAGGGLLRAAITNNTFTYAGTQRAIAIQGGQDGASQLHATVTGNNIDMQLDGTGNATTAIFAQTAVASPTGDNSFLCVDIGGSTPALRNTITHSLGGTMPAGDIRVRQRFVTTVRLPGYGGANNDNAAVVTYLSGRNTLVNAPTATATNEIGVTVGAGGFVGGAACQQPN